MESQSLPILTLPPWVQLAIVAFNFIFLQRFFSHHHCSWSMKHWEEGRKTDKFKPASHNSYIQSAVELVGNDIVIFTESPRCPRNVKFLNKNVSKQSFLQNIIGRQKGYFSSWCSTNTQSFFRCNSMKPPLSYHWV